VNSNNQLRIKANIKMVGLTFCIIMLPSARESRVARAGRRTYTRSTRRGTCRALNIRAPPKLGVGRCGRRSAPRPSAVARGRRSVSTAGAVPSAVRSATKGLLRRCAAAGEVARRLRSRAPPQECVGRRQRADNAVARADGDPRGTECQRIYACARACQYECMQSNMKIH
jgi:hypothetical protein